MVEINMDFKKDFFIEMLEDRREFEKIIVSGIDDYSKGRGEKYFVFCHAIEVGDKRVYLSFIAHLNSETGFYSKSFNRMLDRISVNVSENGKKDIVFRNNNLITFDEGIHKEILRSIDFLKDKDKEYMRRF